MSELTIGPLYRKGEMRKKALGFTRSRVISDELPRYQTDREARLFVERLRDQWVFQTATGGAQFAVTEDDWNAVMDEVARLHPALKQWVKTISYLNTVGHKQEVAQNLPDPPPEGVR